MLKQELNLVCEKTPIRVKWIKAHVGHFGNELADNLAKQGAESSIHGPEPLVPMSKPIIKNLINDHITGVWSARWEKRNDARQTALFFPTLKPANSNDILRLSKDQIGMVVRALTGHDHRSRHKAILDKLPPPPCGLCKEYEGSPSHLILKCPRLNHLS